MSVRTTFRDLLTRGSLIDLPMVISPLEATIAEHLGFDAVMAGAGTLARNGYGLAEGLIGPPELMEFVRRIRGVTRLSIVADLDDGGGSPPHVYHQCRAAENAGADAIIIEDIDCARQFQWDGDLGRWDHDFNRLRPTEAAADNLRVALAARSNPETVLIARTDAFPFAGLDEAMHRSRIYVAAGADAILIVGLPQKLVPQVSKELGVPIANVVSPTLSSDEHASVRGSGLAIAIYPPVIDLYAQAVQGLSRLREASVGSDSTPDVALPNKLLAWTDDACLPVVVKERRGAWVDPYPSPDPIEP